MVSVRLDDLPKFHQILGGGDEPGLEDGDWKLVLLPVEAGQRDFDEAFFGALLHQ